MANSRSGEEDPSHNTFSTIPSYQSLEDRTSPPPVSNTMPETIGGNCSRSTSKSSNTSSLDLENRVELDVEMGGVEAGGDNHSGPWRPIENLEKSSDVIEVEFDKDEEENNSGHEEEGGDTFGMSTSENLHGSFSSESEPEPAKYQWQLYAPDTKNVGKFLRWAMVGGSKYAAEQSDQELLDSLAGLARCLHLLREYLYHYGMPERGGPRDQELLLREVIRDLYAGGAPLWALEPVMQKAAEGLTGQPNVNWQLYPRKAFVYNPSAGTTSMFKMDRGFNISKMSAMEGVVVRLASFASNVQGVSNIPARFPNPQELHRVARTESVRNFAKVESKSKLARKILGLASRQQGLFYYVNSREYQGNHKLQDPLDNSNSQKPPKRMLRTHGVEDFWMVTDEERELFSRLACQEALAAIDAIDTRAKDPERPTIYTPSVIMACRVISAAGACAFWFGGSWQDMIVAGALAIVVAVIGTSSLLTKQERLVYEVVASFIVGLTAGLLALTWPDDMCFSAMAISGVLDLLQGFRVVYAIIEIMSKHTVAGGADLLEGILFTGLISYFLQFGSYVAAAILGNPAATEFSKCTHGIDERLYFLLVPITAMAWAFLFTPNPRDLPGMAFHGVLGYSMNYALSKAGSSSDVNYFVSATVISLSAGIFSRFTGRQAVANTVAGMFTILPGAYLVSSVYSGSLDSDFFVDILKSAVIIGIGGWTGTILCSPTLLGTTRGLLWQNNGAVHQTPGLRTSNSREDRSRIRPNLQRGYATRHLAGSNHHRRQSSLQSAAESSLVQQRGGHRRQPSHASSQHSGTSSSPRCPHHHRGESNASYFDFEHPTTTMLFF